MTGADADFASVNDGTLTVVSQLLDKSQSELIQKRVAAGRSVIVVGATQDVCRQAFELAGLAAPGISEANVEGYAMLSDVDTSHALFAPFHDAKLADFTKLPIWKHRTIEIAAGETAGQNPVRVLARFDGDDPAIVELAAGEPAAGAGRVTLFLFGWHSPDSRFVLWSKFVPLLNAVVDEIATGSFEPTRLIVGDRVSLAQIVGAAVQEVKVTLPSETQTTISTVENSELHFEQPGIYEIAWQSDAGPRTTSLAVNLDPQESRTGPIGIDELRKLGVPLAEDADASLSQDEKRQLQARELESRQRYWQWIILAGLLLLLLETWIAGRMSRGADAVEAA